MKKKFISALILIGFTSMVNQIVLMRELMIVFYGNELSLGITLAGWLFWVGIGGWGLGRFLVPRIKNKLLFFVKAEILFAFLPLFTLLIVRFIPAIIGTLQGEIIGFLPMVYSSFIILSPFCILSGFMFVLGCEIYSSKEEAVKIGYVYIWDAVGISIGGILASFFFIRFFNSFFILTTAGFLNLIPALLLFWPLKKNKKFSFFIIILILVLSFFIVIKTNLLNHYSLLKQWKSFNFVTSKNSLYGNITVTKEDEQYTFFNNGLYMFTTPDLLTSEKIAHFSLLQHPSPKNVLLIGGGVGGVLEEILKYPLNKVDYIELDPTVISLAKKYITATHNLIKNNPRLNIQNTDGRLFIKKTNQTYDVIIINLPEPFTAQLNRFYTQEFFRESKKILTTNGIITFSITSSPNYISEEQKQLLVSLLETLKSVFSEVLIFPGNSNFFFAANSKGILSNNWRILTGRLEKYKIETKYIQDYYLASELSSARISDLEESLKDTGKIKINTDFKPISYFYDMILWSSHFKMSLKNLFNIVTPVRIYLMLLAFYMVILVPVLIKKINTKMPSLSILVAVFTTGFAEIIFQIVTLVGFQIIYGYVYYKLSIILTSFMLGLILGGWQITKMIEKGKGNIATFIKTQMIVCLYPFILPLLFKLFSNKTDSIIVYLGSNIVFAFIPLIAGFIGGFQFPLANKLYMQSQKKALSQTAGLTYGLDLFGSCFGAILGSVFLLPILGISQTCLVVALLNIGSLILLILYKK